MNKWLVIGGVGLLLAWAPFVYSELTASEVEKKRRDLGNESIEDEEDLLAALDEPEPEEEPVPEEEPEDEPEGVEPEAPTEGELEAQEQQPDEAEEGAEGEDGEEEGDEPAPPPPPRLAGPTAVLKSAFDNEPRDALWADGAEARIAGIFDDDEMPEGFFEEAACRKAVCRVSVKWSAEQSEAYLSVHETIREQFGTEIGVEPDGVPDDDGFQKINLYVPREGYTVADLSE